MKCICSLFQSNKGKRNLLSIHINSSINDYYNTTILTVISTV